MGLLHHRVAPRRATQFSLYPHRGYLHLRHRLPVLLEVDRGKGADVERPAGDAVRGE